MEVFISAMAVLIVAWQVFYEKIKGLKERRLSKSVDLHKENISLINNMIIMNRKILEIQNNKEKKIELELLLFEMLNCCFLIAANDADIKGINTKYKIESVNGIDKTIEDITNIINLLAIGEKNDESYVTIGKLLTGMRQLVLESSLRISSEKI